MIAGILSPGNGLGNMLHRYIATRIKALELGVDFSIINWEGFKGKSFMNLDMGLKEDLPYFVEEDTGKIVSFVVGLENWEEWNKNVYDPDWNFIKDNTIIDGNFEDERYFENHLKEIDKWLNVNPDLLVDFYDQDRVCIIGFRGGEYYTVPELGLPKEYYDRAIEMMLEINPNMHFEVHTDDPVLAKQFFPDYEIVNDVAENWTAVRVAKYSIIANSSFYVLPRLLNGGITIAPRYWNRYNTKKWEYPQGYYKEFKYI